MTELPEVYRYAASEAQAARLWAGGITVNVVCLCAYLVVTESSASGSSLFFSVLGFQAVILLLYGAQRAAACVSKERSERTWDLQRITPLTSFEIAAGKLIGAPLFAYFLAASALPWMIVSVFSGPGFFQMLSAYGMLAALVFLTLSLSLMASSYTEGKDSGSVNTGGAVLGFFGLQLVPAFLRAAGKESAVTFHGFHMPWDLFFIASGGLFGAWAFAAARWRIGRDLLERRRAWRLPAFLIFLAAYVDGFFPDNRILAGNLALLALAFPAFFAYGAAFLNREGLEHCRRWLDDKTPGRLDLTPTWLAGWATLVLIAAGLGAARYPWISIRLLVVICAFIGRDMAFLQWCRFTGSKRPEMAALSYLALAYCLPPMVLAAFQAPDSLYLFLPMENTGIGALRNVLPGCLQLIGMAALLVVKI